MKLLETIFSQLFKVSYNTLHTPLMTYVLILVLGLIAAILNWRLIQRFHYSRNPITQFLKYILLFLLLLILGFLIWFVFFHFHTFTKIQY